MKKLKFIIGKIAHAHMTINNSNIRNLKLFKNDAIKTRLVLCVMTLIKSLSVYQ